MRLYGTQGSTCWPRVGSSLDVLSPNLGPSSPRRNSCLGS